MLSFIFHDFDAFAETVRDADMDMVLCNPERRTWDLRFIDAAGVHVQLGNLGSGNLVRGRGKEDQHLLYLPLSGDSASTWNGVALKRGTFGVMPPGSRFTLSEREAHRWISISIPSHLVSGDGEGVGFEVGPEDGNAWVNDAQPALARRITEAALDIARAASCATFKTGPAAKAASTALLQLALPVFGRAQAVETEPVGRPRVPRQTIIERTMALVEAPGRGPVSVGEMAAAAGVSERTLRNTFNESFGMGPVRYLALRQLHQVRRELAAAEPDTVTVTNVLMQHGVWQWGRFAARYRQIFGELPSETLQSKGRRR